MCIATLAVLAQPVHADELDPSAFASCLSELREQAPARSVSKPAFDQFLLDVEADPGVIERLNWQPEFRTAIWDYLSGLVDEERVEDGKERLLQWEDTLSDIEQRYQVDPAFVIAIWGVESDYGRITGSRPVVQSLATLACFGRRQGFFRGELFAALQILENGDIDADALLGSWAGAFGQTQFMPSSFLRNAVDFDGDGRRDLVGSVPDALASTANYLRQSNWRHGEPWGLEVQLPEKINADLLGRTRRRPVSEWLAMGVQPLNKDVELTDTWPAAIIVPAGTEGPAFLVLRNFNALYSYNAAESYALAIAHLADRVRGGEGFQTAWPTSDRGLSRAERREVQSLLQELGEDPGEIDGMIGSRTRDALTRFMAGAGAEFDTRVGWSILDKLRQARAAMDEQPQSGSDAPEN